MQGLFRCSSLLLFLLLTACGGGQHEYPPLHYGYLRPLRLNVATIEIQQHFVPSNVPPDVSQLDPVQPVQALRNMAEDRLQAFGSSGRAVFVIQNASLTRRGDTAYGDFDVEIDIYSGANVRAAYAEARVSATHTGDADEPSTLYAMTKDMMDRMNVEIEYQMRRSLGQWLLPEGVVQPPVQQQPLVAPPPPVPAAPPAPR
jgi:hypothetical protein